MIDILNIKDEPIFDDRIVKIDTHNPWHVQPVRQHNVQIQQRNKNTHTATGHTAVRKLSVRRGKTKEEQKVVQSAHVTLGNNCVAFIFDEIRYELTSVEIVTETWAQLAFKNYVTVSSDRSVILRNAGWDT